MWVEWNFHQRVTYIIMCRFVARQLGDEPVSLARGVSTVWCVVDVKMVYDVDEEAQIAHPESFFQFYIL